MLNMSDIIKFGCLSDEQRWDANRYDWPWLTEIDDHDKKIIKKLACIADGEFSGQASAAQTYDLFFQEIRNGYPKELTYDWGEILSYVNIIVYEETRHGLALSTLYHYATTGELNYTDKLSVRDYSQKYIWCYEDRKYWNLYSYTLAHLFGEIINTELYRDIRSQLHHPELKNIIGNIMKDEARHMQAWTAIIKNLIHSNTEHKRLALENIDVGLTYHNAMVHETYFEGQNDVMGLFITPNKGEDGAIDRIVKKKYTTLIELFGEDNPYNLEEVKKQHMQFLMDGLGKTRAVYSENAPNHILFS
ncbi:unnamed protein product [Commensalibacter communis]|uniref:hypothetical protein n=1 Tax=Commensalibacter communis TaxID=2972786 RepID=UPI0022FF7C13|nr:hypothetical protein [Commensalibacter communis]CAI3954167.1 unnamed protein product [Commensalibacter communis]CAI3954955.1 unnamed protein product [Commensalibacter communis]